MSEEMNQSDTARRLPLTEHTGGPAPCLPVDEALIRVLVDTFYDSVKTDDLLAPIFAAHVADWSTHLPKMYDFWSTVVLRTGRYSGRPLEAHERLPGLTRIHFDRWVSLWAQTVERVVPHAGRDSFIVPARRMAMSMSSILLRDGASGS